MVEIVFDEANFFKKIIDSLKGLVDTITFQCTSTSMDLQAMDVSHVSLISISLPEEIFQTYNCSEPMDLSFNVDSLTKVLKSASSNESLRIFTEKPNEDIEIQITTPNEDISTCFKLKPVDNDQEPVQIPDHTYKAKLSLGSNAFNLLVRSLSDIDDSVSVKCTEGSISFSVNDNSVEATTTYNSGITSDKAEEEIDVDVSEACKVSYALRYLKAISGASGLAPRVSLSFSTQFPLLVEYDLMHEGFVRFYLAPKVTDDESDDDI